MRRMSWMLPLAVGLAAGCNKDAEDDTSKDGGPEPEVCLDDAAFFEQKVWTDTLQPVCLGCHTADGAARKSDLVLVPPTRPDHLEINRAVLENVAGLERDDVSIILRKPLGLDNHGGGKVLTDEDDPRYQHLVEFIDRMANPITCDNGDEVDDVTAGLELLSPTETLRKASLLMVGRLPTVEETTAVRNGGEDALVQVLWQMMGEDAFIEIFTERLNDVLLTDRYLRGADAIGIFDEDRFPTVRWYEGIDDGNRSRDATNDAIAREPLALAAHILRNDRPWTEILTADYTLVDAFSRRAWGLTDTTVVEVGNPESEAWQEVRIPDFPHAGVLTTPAFLNRYPTTDTNRNRHRSWFFFKTFLATDILNYADRPIDPDTSATFNPTLNDPQCTVCHATMDPVAGAFQNWNDDGEYRPPENGWYGEMAPPGFGEQALPAGSTPTALQWLAQQAVEDPRFGAAAVRLALQMYTHVPIMDVANVGDDDDKKAALALQDAFTNDVATELADRGWDFKYAIERVILSRYFRAENAGSALPGALQQAGTAHLLTPEELERKNQAVIGMPWASGSNRTPYLMSTYNMLYGGIDSFSVTERLTEANGVMAAIITRMANKLSCEAVPREFVLGMSQRRLFPYVEPSFVPVTDDGFPVPGAEQAIRENIRWLHLRMLGEDLALDDPEIDRTYALWVDVWTTGRDAIDAGDESNQLPWECQARADWWSGDAIPSDRIVQYDRDYTIRAWMAVVGTLLQDYRYLYE